MSNKIYGAIADDGGGTGALDSIDGSLLTDGDVGIVCDYSASVVEVYRLVAGSGAAEVAGEPYPTIIAPVNNAGTKRWILVGSVAQGLTLAKNNTYLNIYDEATPPVLVGTLKIDASGHTHLNAKTGGNVLITVNGTAIGTWSASGVTLAAGATINEFSIDGTLAGNSDTAVPTEKAVKTYVDAITQVYQEQFFSGKDLYDKFTNGSAVPVENEAGGNANYWSLSFDGTSIEYAYVVWRMPEIWDGGTIKAKFWWTPAGTPSVGETVCWGISGRCFKDGDTRALATGNFADAAADAVISTTAVHISAATAACTLACSGVAAGGDYVYFQIRRDPGSDDMPEDATLMGVAIQYGVSGITTGW